MIIMSKIPKIFLQIKILNIIDEHTLFTISKQDIDLNTHFIEGHLLYKHTEHGVRLRIFSDCFPAIYGPNYFNNFQNIEFYIKGSDVHYDDSYCKISNEYLNTLCNAILKFNLKLNNVKFTNKIVFEDYRDLFILR